MRFCSLLFFKHSNDTRLFGRAIPKRPGISSVHVRRRVDVVGKLWHGDFESALNVLEDLVVIFARDKHDRETLGTETTGTTDPVQVRGCRIWGVVRDRDVDALHIDTTAKDCSDRLFRKGSC